MAVKTKEEILSTVASLVGEERTEADETIAFLEDIADTYDDLAGQIAEDYNSKYAEYETKLSDADAKYAENETAWKKRYTERFLKGSETEEKQEEKEEEKDPDEPQPTEDLFKKE